MEKFNSFLSFLSKLWGPPGLSPELQKYCEREGLDAWALLEAAKQARETTPARRTALPRSTTGEHTLTEATGAR